MREKRRSAALSGIAGAGVMIVLSALLVIGSKPLYTAVAGRNRKISEVPIYYAGTYEGTSRGYGGPVTVRTTVSDYAIEEVRILAPEETPEIGKAAAVQLSDQMWRDNSFLADSISGATMTSSAVRKAAGQCLEQAAREGTEAEKLLETEFQNAGEGRSSEEEKQIGELGLYRVLTYGPRIFRPSELILKRVMDILGAAVGICLTVLIGLFVVPAIKLESPGPAVFKQTRIGKNGRKFSIYKFRSMYMDAEERKKELMKQNEMDGLMFKMKDDPRITKVGKFIRKTSIDELPQFFNVLRGDMSLVGTRPPTVDEFERYEEHHKRRLSLRPGITGMWQVSGRSDIQNFEDVVRLDLEYIDNWSVWLDIKILFQTVFVVLLHRGAE